VTQDATAAAAANRPTQGPATLWRPAWDVRHGFTRLREVHRYGTPKTEKAEVATLGPFRSPVSKQGGNHVAKQERRTIKATFSLDVDLVTRLNACATLRNTSRDALATAALEEAVKGLVLFDRAKPARRSTGKDRAVPEDGVSPDDGIAA
jgi:hypothetical protein